MAGTAARKRILVVDDEPQSIIVMRGSADYITKPVDSVFVLSVVRRLLGAS